MFLTEGNRVVFKDDYSRVGKIIKWTADWGVLIYTIQWQDGTYTIYRKYADRPMRLILV